jgi:hypothetical protein
MYRLLVSDDGAEINLMNEMLDDLPPDIRVGQNGPLLKDMKRAVATTIEQAQQEIKGRREPPSLLIVAATVRQSRTALSSVDGGPASDFLQSVKNDNIPTLVISSVSLEKLMPEIVLRTNVALWRPEPKSTLADLERAHAAFARTLQGLGSTETSHRVTVSVKARSATYNIVSHTISLMKGYRPYLNGVLRMEWQKELTACGRATYSFLMKHAIGKALLEAMERSGKIDLQFHLDMQSSLNADERADLFELPFEATNHSDRAEEFFCVRVPVARRVRSTNRSVANPPSSNDVRRMLAVFGAAGGVAGVQGENTGQQSLASMKQLEKKCEFQKFLQSSVDLGSVKLELLDETKARGDEFISKLENLLRENQFDIVHFYGHSVNLGPKGTFLFAPGETDDDAKPLSIRAVCDWMADKRTKASPPHLVFLSSCESGSTRTALEMMDTGIEYILGFRWEVEEQFAMKFITRFYSEYFKKNSDVRQSYWQACKQIQSMHMGQPEWASAILLN